MRVTLALLAVLAFLASLAPSGAVTVTLSHERNPREITVAAIRNATRSIDAAVYKLSDEPILDALLDALDRGVRLTLLFDKDENDASGEMARDLEDAGADVRYYKTDRYDKLHAKFAIYDGTTAIAGSANWSDSSGEDNMEIVFFFDDRQTVNTLVGNFDALWSDGESRRFKSL